MQTDGYVTAAKLKDAYLGIGIKQETLLKLFEQHNSEFAKKVGHSRAKGTFRRYVTVCKHIREFLPHTYKREDIPLKELNLSFINDFSISCVLRKMPHQYHLGLHDCAETHYFHSEE